MQTGCWIAGLIILLFMLDVSAEHLVYGKVLVEGDSSVGAADGARVRLENERSSDACSATVGDEQTEYWSVDVDKCMDWESGDEVTINVKMDSLTGSDSMTLSSGGSQSASIIYLSQEADEEGSASAKKEKATPTFKVYPEGGRGSFNDPGPYCELNTLMLRFYKSTGGELHMVTINITRLPKRDQYHFRFVGDRPSTKVIFNETGKFRVFVSSPYIDVDEYRDLEIIDCGYREMCSNGKKDLIEFYVDCGGKCPPCENNVTVVETTASTTTSTTSTIEETTSTTTTSIETTTTVEQVVENVSENASEEGILLIAGNVIKPPQENVPPPRTIPLGVLVFGVPVGVYGAYLSLRRRTIPINLQKRRQIVKGIVMDESILPNLASDDIMYLKDTVGWVDVTEDVRGEFERVNNKNLLSDIFKARTPKENGIKDKSLSLAKDLGGVFLTNKEALIEEATNAGITAMDYKRWVIER